MAAVRSWSYVLKVPKRAHFGWTRPVFKSAAAKQRAGRSARQAQQAAIEIEKGDAAGKERGIDAKLRGEQPDTQGRAPGEHRRRQRRGLGERGGRDVATGAGHIVNLVPKMQEEFHPTQ